jgi:hypothetical protein
VVVLVYIPTNSVRGFLFLVGCPYEGVASGGLATVQNGDANASRCSQHLGLGLARTMV